jgi:hypothetical protein
VATLLAGTLHAGCSSDARDLFVVQFDAGAEAEAAAARDAEPEVDPTLGGPCSEDSQCDDLVACTYDACDRTLSRCRNTPDDAQCSDGLFCNGDEVCRLRRGCVAGPVASCQDNSGCTIDVCVEAAKACEHRPRDTDGDGDPDDHCEPRRDCDDTDPTVNSLATEICDNFKDDNCNGTVDEEPCARGANDVCATALDVRAPGNFLLSTLAAKKDYPTTCSVASPDAARDLVVAITVPADGDARDVLVRAETSAPSNEVAVALQRTCGDPIAEIGCGHIDMLPTARAIARDVAPGATVYAIVTSQRESSVDVKVEMPPASRRPENEGCATPWLQAPDVPFEVRLIDAAKDLPSGCDDRARTGELTYAFILAEPKDVRIFASTLSGAGQPVVSLRRPECSAELRCRVGASPPVFARNLGPGKHVFTVAGTAQLDASVLVKTYAPSPPPPDQSCADPPAIAPNTTLVVNLADHEDAIESDCLPGGPNAAYRLFLDAESDVLVVGRFASNDRGAVSLNGPDCTPIACGNTGSSPVRVSRRNVPLGEYRVVIADERAQNTELLVLVRPTTPPVTVTSDGCDGSPVLIPETGGYFTGDTTEANADFSAGCDAVGQPTGGARDQLLRLDLTARRRVIFDMLGSSMTTLLDLRKGAACPGIEVPDACMIGGAQRSFLDVVLDPGTYWVQVDGYNGQSGPWRLDVRVLPP